MAFDFLNSAEDVFSQAASFEGGVESDISREMRGADDGGTVLEERINPDGSTSYLLPTRDYNVEYDEFTGLPKETGLDSNEFVGEPPAFISDLLSNFGPVAPIPEDSEPVRSPRTVSKPNNDWRVRLSLAPNADYLYKDPMAHSGILQPLIETKGILFPYTPRIDTIYHANYNTQDLTHSNYRGYFYQNSYPGEIMVNATFTAQDTHEANYMLAVIHFLKASTKMFYGQSQHRGSPPPLLYLNGLGEFQFNNHPCALTVFNYNLPNDVDYIKAGDVGYQDADFLMKRDPVKASHQSWSSKITRLINSGLTEGAEEENATSTFPDVEYSSPIKMGDLGVTYVPSRLDISLTLLPIQTREQQSKQYSSKYYGYGTLTRKGFY